MLPSFGKPLLPKIHISNSLKSDAYPWFNRLHTWAAEEAVKEEDIGKVTYKLGLLRDKDKKINGTATLNNITYKAQENERGLVLSAVEKTD